MPLDGQDLDYVTLTPVAEELLAAKRYLQRHGWCQGIGSNDRGNVCLFGAMVIVGSSEMAFNRLARSVRESGGVTIVAFNDHSTTDVYLVHEVLDHAIRAEVG